MPNLNHLQLGDACRDWYESPAGEYALASLNDRLEEYLSEIFGYFALETGVLIGKSHFLEHSKVKTNLTLGRANQQGDIVAEIEQLPVDFDSVDLVIGSHILECSAFPHQVLREVDRVLVSQGHCILIGFNPMAWWFGRRSFCKRDGQSSPRFYGVHQVRDWFSLLGWEIQHTSYHSFRPSFLRGKVFDRLENMEKWGPLYWPIFGNIYMIHARKLDVIRPPSKVKWESAVAVLPGKVAINPTSRSSHQRGKPYD
ncbi:MAG: Unknown protein [uncultured Thiotrichaceae bacterium]|uniref:Methyltransferase type 11 domain-containing protein n=1 Tax=uncultured Thiotrichaceae bacterium TaxID=298394 RepID=A0A6S6UHG8_9GAMM|nr:MAG: Unknown protein [uncultured Thiotrichaceae bacterium]